MIIPVQEILISKETLQNRFFNMLWKSVFDGVKKTAIGKK